MEIIKLELKDFRQFYGSHMIEFGNNERNITIILGANGNGKTGIFRAIMFALYGDVLLEQDNKNKDLVLVNLEKLEENLGLPVEASVKLSFEHKGTRYIIERHIQMIKESNDKIISNNVHTNFYKVGLEGDFEKITEDSTSYINDILHKDIREFFFFDAEKMELLNNTRSQRKITKEVKEGIVKLLQIKSLDDSEKLLKELIDQENKKISLKAKDSDMNEKEKLKLELTEQVEQLEEENVILLNDRELALKEIEKHQKDLSSNEKIRDLQEEKVRQESSLSDSIETFNEQKNYIKKLLKDSTHLLALDYLESKELEFKGIKNNQKDTFPLDMIESSLNYGECQLCRQGISHDTVTYDRLKEMEKAYSFSDLTPIINGIQTTSQKLKREEPQIKGDVDSYIQKIVQTEEAIERKEMAVRKTDEAIKDKAELLDNLKVIEKQLSSHKKNEENFKNKILQNELEIKNAEQEIVKLENIIHMLSLKHKDLHIDSQIVAKLRDMKGILASISTEYTEEIIVQLSAEMTKTFRNLLSQKDRSIFEKVIINEKYEISVLDKVGNNRVQELSMGQGQIFTLAFITTLAKLASKGRDEINFPLFMDTPFGRISGENRDNLISQIPVLTNQWILLLTDTELTAIEQKAFDNYKKVGKVYELVNEEGKTCIEEKHNIMELEVRR